MPPSLPLFCVVLHQQYWFPVLQIQGRSLPLETICLQTSSFTTGTDFSWSREVVRYVSISCVRNCLILDSLNSFFWWWHVCILTPPNPKRVPIDSFFIHFILDSPQYLGYLLSSPLCRADWGAGYNLKEGGRTYWRSYGEAHVGGAERWSHWHLCQEHSVSPQ